MGNLKGAMFFFCCLTVAIALWSVNIIYVDNALPEILTDITAALSNPICDMTGWAKLFMSIERMAPLFLAFIGLVGWILELYVFGARSYGSG